MADDESDREGEESAYGHLEDEDLIERYRDFVVKHDEIKAFTDKMFDVFGMSRDEASNFLSNPSNFGDEGWKILQERHEKLEQELLAGISKFQEGGDISEGKQPKRPNQKRKRKGKKRFIGQRKGWISLD